MGREERRGRVTRLDCRGAQQIMCFALPSGHLSSMQGSSSGLPDHPETPALGSFLHFYQPCLLGESRSDPVLMLSCSRIKVMDLASLF